MTKWLIFRPDGGVEQFTEGPKHRGRRDHPRRHYPEDHEFVQVDRHTDDPCCEHFDRAKGQWVRNDDHRVELDRKVQLDGMTGSELYAEIEKMVIARLSEAASQKTKR